jgi:hypothetical protein
MSNDTYRCRTCDCLWRENGDDTWSLADEHQVAKGCCDNVTEMIPNLERVSETATETWPCRKFKMFERCTHPGCRPPPLEPMTELREHVVRQIQQNREARKAGQNTVPAIDELESILNFIDNSSHWDRRPTATIAGCGDPTCKGLNCGSVVCGMPLRPGAVGVAIAPETVGPQCGDAVRILRGDQTNRWGFVVNAKTPGKTFVAVVELGGAVAGPYADEDLDIGRRAEGPIRERATPVDEIAEANRMVVLWARYWRETPNKWHADALRGCVDRLERLLDPEAYEAGHSSSNGDGK